MDSRGNLLDRPWPDVDALRPVSLGNDPDFAQLMRTMESQCDLMREQLASFREQARAAEASERRSFAISIASLVVSALSLAIALVSLLNQFHVI
ncbi:hypothetical protein [Thermophilibacter sp.]